MTLRDALPKLAISAGMRSAVANFGWLGVERVVRILLGLTIGSWIPRHLGPQDYGVLAAALAAVALMMPLARMGLDAVLVKSLVNRPEDRTQLLLGAFLLRTVASVLVFTCVLTLGSKLLNVGPDLAVLAAAATTLLWSPMDVIVSEHQADLTGRRLISARVLAALVAAGANVYVIMAGAPLVAFAWISSAEALLGTCLLWLARPRSTPASGLRLDATKIVALVGESWPLALAGIAVIVYMKIDVLMLSAMSEPADAGVYAAAARLSELWYFVPTALAASLTPGILRSKRLGFKAYRIRVGALIELLTILSIIVATVTSLFAGLVTNLLYGSSFDGAAGILRLHIWAGVFVSSGVAQSVYMVNERLNTITLAKTSLGAITNVGLNLLLIPTLGGTGAAIATVIAYGVAAVGANVIFPPTRPLFRLQICAILVPCLRRYYQEPRGNSF